MANSLTTPRDNFVHGLRGQQNRINKPLGGSLVSFDYNQGDLCWYDSAVNYAKPLDSDAHAAYLIGPALRSAYIAPYASANLAGGPALVKSYFPSGLFGFGDVYTFFTTAGDTYVDGTAVYFGADAQTITAVAGSHTIGQVYLPAGNGLASVAGGSGILVPVLVVPQIPVQTL